MGVLGCSWLVVRERTAMTTMRWAMPPHVLVVDDDAVTRATLGRLLQAMGCTSNVAVDGVDAVQKIGEQRYDLVLMDIVMPRIDGVAATSLIRRFNHAIVIVGMTSHVQPAAVVAYYAAGMNDVLTKPFGRDGLRAVLDRHLWRSEERQEEEQMPLNTHMTDEQYESLVQNFMRRNADASGGERSGPFSS
ncbi:CheY-like superfamily [Mucidula mucida]|nr:CheY-like superfamily [Mucidula mucida]